MRKIQLEDLKKLVWRIVYFRNPVEYARKKGVRIGSGNSFVDHPNFGSEPYLVSLGNNNRISFGCTFVTHDGGRWVLDNLYPDEKPFLKFGTIEIGDNNFLGARSIINPCVRIGSNCIIAAGSIVTKNVPSGEVWGGVPAKRIMSIEEYRDKLIHNKNEYDLTALREDKRSYLLKKLVDGEKKG